MKVKFDVVSDTELVAPCPGAPGAAPITVKIVADSINSTGDRLITWCWEYWRGIHEEVMTHRDLSRNSASSRAIPAKKMRDWVTGRPAVPFDWGKNQKGMQSSEEQVDPDLGREWWLRGLDMMARHHEEGERLGLHKQTVNRVIQPWMMIAVVVSSTQHANLFHLRKHEAAEPHFQVLATLAWELYHNHMPKYLWGDRWHLPYVDFSETIGGPPDDFDAAFDMVGPSHENLRKISVGRCARVSYLTHEGRRDPVEDVALHDRLAGTASLGADPMHASPFEHQATPTPGVRHGNFQGWKQYRKFFPREAGPDTSDKCQACGCWGGRHVPTCKGSRT